MAVTDLTEEERAYLTIARGMVLRAVENLPLMRAMSVLHDVMVRLVVGFDD